MNSTVKTLRLAVISTPRSGNCWLRHMLAETLELEHIIVHLPSEVSWDNLPERAILQLHWLPEEAFRTQLAKHDFRVIVLARHPLDVLISILAFSQHDDSTLRWLDGAGGSERSLAGAAPLSESFLDYAIGSRAKQLLGVSAEWWNLPGVCRVHYESLMLDPAGRLAALIAELGVSPRKSPVEVAARSTPDDMRAQNVHMLFHVWQAQGSLWRRFLTEKTARQIHQAHGAVFTTLSYACDPNPLLFAADAQADWNRYDAAAAKKHLHGVKRTIAASLQHSHSEFHRQRTELARLAVALDELRTQHAELRKDLVGLGPWSLGAARWLQRWAHYLPRATASLKSTVLLSRRILRMNHRSARSE